MKKPTLLAFLRTSRFGRYLAFFLALNLIAEIVSPTVAMALTSGPAAPEFSSFEPVATTNMVNDFSGDFTYNLPVLSVPGPDGGGYSMSLSYHSGVSSEEEASWVGFGWTLNPGAINRGKKGYPDEYNGATVHNYNKARPNWTQESQYDFNMEPNSKDQEPKTKDDKQGKPKKFKLQLSGMQKPPAAPPGGDAEDMDLAPSISLQHTVRYNNYSGFEIGNSVGVSAKDKANDNSTVASANWSKRGSVSKLGFYISPSAILRGMNYDKNEKNLTKQQKNWKKRLEKASKAEQNIQKVKKYVNVAQQLGVVSYNSPSIPYSVARSVGAKWKFSGSIQVNPGSWPLGFQMGLAGDLDIEAQEGHETKQAYGYLNSNASNTNTSDQKVWDYHLEKASTFEPRDKYLGIPFNNADVFSASGGDVMGAFRFSHSTVGAFHPNYFETEKKLRNLSVEIGIGATFQVGIDFGVGKQVTKVGGSWPMYFGSQTALFSSSVTPRFINDPGGEVNYDNDDEQIQYASIFLDKTLDLSQIDNQRDDTKYKSTTDISYVKTSDKITAITITNKDGSVSSYTENVMTGEEVELTVGVASNQDGNYLVTQQVEYDDPLKNSSAVGQRRDVTYANTYLLTEKYNANYIDATGNGPSADDFGGWTKFHYQTKYGGGTNYKADWYRFRSPYAGLTYNSGRLIDNTDQSGSMSSGFKEVKYLKLIETKSHIAFFVTDNLTNANFQSYFPSGTYSYLYSGGSPLPSILAHVKGSGVSRRDGLSAKGIVGTKDGAAEDLTAKGTKTQEKLEKIVLFAKSDLTTPLTTTFFDYDYSLCPGIPNTSEPTSSPSKERGKLTLKKVWTESNGITRTQIAPYQFFYEYFNQYPTHIATAFDWAQDYNVLPSNDPNQNPWYQPEALDPWGFYQEDGDKRFKKSQNWVSQRALTGNTTFDPAAWQLKRIKLPSGGEIHVHYEQKDYAAVQDLLPMAMVSLKDGAGVSNGYKSDDSAYMINLSDIGVDPSDAAAYEDLLEQYFLTERNKLYFKVLYTYDGDEKPELNTGKNKYEYATGYTVVNKVTRTGNDIVLSLGERRNLLAGGKRDKTLPRYVCYQNAMSNGYHTLGKSAGGFKSDDYTNNAYKGSSSVDPNDLKDAARNSVLDNSLDMFWDWLGGRIKNLKRKEACKTLNFEYSYFKLPVFHAKKGGGIRVKRLLTYDAGISGDSKGETVYGSEFIYEAQNGSSSGVAVNEPAEMREESALTVFMERKRQRWFEQFRKQMPTSAYEGVPGESVLPGAEVGHTRVIIKNIRENISSGGYVVKNYHTCKEYPFKYDYTNLTKKDKTYRNFDIDFKWNQKGKPFQFRTGRAWVAQGYLFTLNDMHGKIKDETTYPGLYSPTSFYNTMPNDGNTYNRSVPVKPVGKVFYENTTNAFQASEPAFTNKTTYKYSEPGAEIPLITYDAATRTFSKELAKPGKEQDLTIYESTVTENMTDFSIELDINIQFPPIAVTLGFWGTFKISQDLICQHVTSKVVSHKTHLLSTTTSNSGVWQTTENLAFDKYTADPVFTRTFDGYGSKQNALYTMAGGTTPHSGFIYALNIPAAWVYPDMRPKSYGTSNLNTLGGNAGSIVTYSDNPLYDQLINSANSTYAISASPFDNVLSATSTTYKKGWFTTGGTGLTGTALTKANAQYFPEETFNYRDEVSQGGITGGKIYNAGTVNGPIAFFDWLNPTSNSTAWYSPSKATKYSPHGYPVEEQDLLKIKSSARYGYDDMLPVTVAQNAGYDDIKFLDFEYTVPGLQTQGTTAVAHTGTRSFDLAANQNQVFVPSYPVSSDILARGLSVRFWLRSRLSNVATNINYGLKNQNPMLKVKLGNQQFECDAIAQTGEWTLYAADIINFQGLNTGNHNISLAYNMSTTETVYIDDFRVQPLDASSKCSVYFADHRLAAQFDDQHFATLYEYNNKGQLVRKSIETERGLKTLQEQQYNTPLINN
jgi:hypothetical protein